MNRMRLASVEAFQHRDVVGVGLDRVGDLCRRARRFCSWHRHRQALKAARGRSGAAVDGGGLAARDVSKQGSVDRRSRLERTPEADGTILPSIMCPMPSARSLPSGNIAIAVGLKAVRRLRGNLIHVCALFQRLVEIVALPACVLVIDLHVER